MIAIGISLMVIAIVIQIVYLVYNDNHHRDIKYVDMLISWIILIFWLSGYDILLSVIYQDGVHEIQCNSPAEITYVVKTVEDEAGNACSDTIYVYRFNRKINVKHYSEK